MKPLASVFTGILFLSNAFQPVSAQSGLDTFSSRAGLIADGIVTHLVYGGGRFLTQSSTAELAYTTDGVNWTRLSPVIGPNTPLDLLAHGNGTFVGVRNPGRFLYSSNGESWTEIASPTLETIHDLEYDGGLFLACGNNGTLLTSPDGVNWSLRTTGVSFPLNAVGHASGKFLAMESNGRYVHSADAETWTEATLPRYGGTGRVPTEGQLLVAGDDEFFFAPGRVSNQGSPGWTDITVRSEDGLTWSYGAYAASTAYKAWFLNGHFLGRGGPLGLASQIARSENPPAWIAAASLPANANPVIAAAHGNGFYFLMASDGTSHRSSDLGTWISLVSPGYLRGDFVAVAELGDIRVAVGDIVARSAAGSDYQAVPGAPTNLTAVTAGMGRFVAVGSFGRIVRSADGLSWSAARSPTTRALRGVATGAGAWVAVGDEGRIVASLDGTTWSTVWSGTDLTLRGVTFANGKFVAVGDLGTVLTSPDGWLWTTEANASMANLHAVGGGGGQFLAVGAGGAALISPDGSSWSIRDTGTAVTLTSVSQGGGTFVVTGGSQVFSSVDGSAWQARTPALANTGIVGSAYMGGRFTLVGNDGTGLGSFNLPILLESDPVGVMLNGLAPLPSGEAMTLNVTGGTLGGQYALRATSSLDNPVWTDVQLFTQTNTTTRLILPLTPGIGVENFKVESR